MNNGHRKQHLCCFVRVGQIQAELEATQQAASGFMGREL